MILYLDTHTHPVISNGSPAMLQNIIRHYKSGVGIHCSLVLKRMLRTNHD